MKKGKKTGILFVAVLAVILVLAMTLGMLFYAYAMIPMKYGDIVSAATPKTYKTQILDDKGNVIQTLSGEASNRVYVELENIPEDLQNAFVAIEDERFYKHHGIDVKAILRSVVVGIKNGGFSQGGSTITQQLVKNNVLTTWTEEKTFIDKAKRKIDEMCLALQLETQESKEQILQNYLNTINLGGGCWGVQTASQYYFGKDVGDLNLSECAVIAAITQNPTGYNPVMNPENSAEKREVVLKHMLDQGYISSDAYQEALADNVYERIASLEHHTDSEEVMSYFEDAIVLDVISKLKEQYGYTDDQASAMVYQGGLTIYSTQDSDLQRICEEEANNENWYDTDAQISLVLIDQSDGEVKAIVGGRGEKTADLVYNRATDSQRQIGSVVKVIGEYAAAMDNGGLTLGSALADSPYCYADGTEVYNWDYRFQGNITVRNAIIESNNIAALRAMEMVGIEGVMESLKNFGITTLTEDDAIESIALGGTTNGMTNLEVTGAYSALANGGVYQKPVLFTKVVDHNGKEVLVNDADSHQAVSSMTAALLTDAMKDVITQGTGTACQINGMEVAGKSGTTNDTKDAWFVGYSPYLTLGVWGGFDENHPQENSGYVKNIWRAVMERAHEGLEYKEFGLPSGVVSRNICTKCGKLALRNTCNHTVQGDMTKEEIFAVGTEPASYCDCHELVTICKETGMRAGVYCTFAGKETVAYLKSAVPGTEEENYVLDYDLYSQTCTKHTSIWDKLFGPGSKKEEDRDDQEYEDDNNESYDNDGYDNSYGDDYYEDYENDDYDGQGNHGNNGNYNGDHNYEDYDHNESFEDWLHWFGF